jgi:hypothetical protein
MDMRLQGEIETLLSKPTPSRVCGNSSKLKFCLKDQEYINGELIFRGGYFVRTDPILNFDWQRGGAATIPVNLGFGKIVRIGSRPVNAYVQPEWTVHHPTFPSSLTPKFTIRLSFTLLYPEREH